ncbi:phosphate ABC transporter permease PstA [Sphingomonas sp. BIUV-7]|uniref:Phosphate transport system permease protein PstA n=1 Tax=Sphingomonas natans TaxID=3063330 RepID=A0ABT8Y4E1_9SPHN|nr:phosphate ABC transporter permease PstA [Sphingomonas sp. BIUV-7]MDO6412783.1 phosphate ABC transporter permease PstA [Sphingomonas sp. BIUV-7]
MTGSRAMRRRLANWLFVGLCGLATAIALGLLVAILWTLVSRGISGLGLVLFTLDQPAPGSHGGLRNAIVGSLIMCGMGMAAALVIGILAGTWLAEYAPGTRAATVVRFLNDVLLSAPSILIGLFVYELLVAPFGGFSGYAGAVALAFVATPIVVRTTEDILLLQPAALREAGMALGAGRALVIRRIVWRAARTGLLTGGLLGFARISGETAPLLFTSLGNQFFNADPSQPMASLPTTIFQFALSAYDEWQSLAWAGALLIAAAVLVVNIVGRILARESHSL